MSHPKFKEFKKIIDDWMYFSPCLGMNLTIYDADYGYSNFSNGYKSINPEKRLEEQAPFYIYSITKTFTAILLMQLVEKKVISLDDPIVKYLPNTQLAKEVTIEHLLNHTSGVSSYTDLPNYMKENKKNPSKPWSFEYVIEKTCKTKLDFASGEKWHYSNTGYMLLLLMIESVTSESYAKNVDDLIVKKIGLKNTHVAETIDSSRVTNGYSRHLSSKNKIENITSKYNPWWCKTGLIVSTSEEITKLYEALFKGKLIELNSLAKMTKAVPIMQPAGPHFKKPSYGFGLMIDPENRYGASYGHGGDGPGANTWSVYYPKFDGRSVGVTLFCNTSIGGHPLDFVDEVLQELRR